MRTSRTSPAAVIVTALTQGILLSAGLLVLEAAVLGADGRAALGSPLPVIAGVYGAVGAVAGVAAAIVALLLSRRFRLAPLRFTLPVLVWFFVAAFVLRTTTAAAVTSLRPVPLLVLAAGVAAVVIALWRARSGSESRTRARRIGPRLVFFGSGVLIVLLAVLWPSLVHHALPARDTGRPDAPNIVFILVDALRMDRVSSFGYSRPTTPVVDRIAMEGVRFTRAYAHGNRTIISMPALFTSLYPALTGASAFEDLISPLPEEQVTIADLCREAGYTSFAMMNNIYVKSPFGLAQGFDRVEEFNPGRFNLSVYRLLLAARLMKRPRYDTGTAASATEVTDAALRWLARAPEEAPFFCYVHYMDVHHPYMPPDEFESMFRSRESLAAISPRSLFAKTVELVRKKEPFPLNDDDLTRLSDLYDACIRYVDTEIGRLLDAAVRVDNGRPTLVVFTSDHGDEFQEKGCLYHNNVVIEELIRVPLVIWRSDQPFRAEVTDLVRHIDVLPTIAEWIGADVPAAAMGRSLVPLINGEALPPSSSIAEGDYCSAFVEPPWKIMRVDTSGVESLFDLAADPWASSDVSREHPEHWTRMRAALDGYLRTVEPLRAQPSATANEETLRQLRSLGYLN